MTNLWLRKLWILIVTFILFSVMKYLYKALGLTKNYKTYLEVESIWNDNTETAAWDD